MSFRNIKSAKAHLFQSTMDQVATKKTQEEREGSRKKVKREQTLLNSNLRILKSEKAYLKNKEKSVGSRLRNSKKSLENRY